MKLTPSGVILSAAITRSPSFSRSSSSSDQQDPALPDLLDTFLDRGEGHDVPLKVRATAADISRSRPSRRSPPGHSASPPKVVTASVCGITITSKVRGPRSAMVRLTPSTATDPWGPAAGPARSRQPDPHPRRRFYTGHSASTVATPSTCPRTRCPPRRPQNRSGRSRFTRVPARSRPSVVRTASRAEVERKAVGERSATCRERAPLTARWRPTRCPRAWRAPRCQAGRRPAAGWPGRVPLLLHDPGEHRPRPSAARRHPR